MAKLRPNQLTNIPQTNVEGLTVELLSKATASYTDSKLYVDALNGDDANSGSFHSPRKTIQATVDSLPLIINHPIEIILAKGIYTETIQFTKHTLGADGFIIVKPDHGATVVLSGDRKLDHCVIVDFAQGVCIKDVTIQGFKKEAVKVINSAKIDMNRCVLRDNFIALSISNQASTYTLDNCVFLNNQVGVKVFNTSTADIANSSFELNKVAVSVESLSTVFLIGAKVSSNVLAFESLSKSLLDLKNSVVVENSSVARVDLATLSSRNLSKPTLISNNNSGVICTKASVVDLQNVDMINNKQVDIVVDSGSTALIEDCAFRKSSPVFAMTVKRGNQAHLMGTTRERSSASNLYDPSHTPNVFG